MLPLIDELCTGDFNSYAALDRLLYLFVIKTLQGILLFHNAGKIYHSAHIPVFMSFGTDEDDEDDDSSAVSDEEEGACTSRQ